MKTPGSHATMPPSPASRALASGRASLISSYLAPGGALARGKGFDRAHADLLDWFLAGRLAEINDQTGAAAADEDGLSYAIVAVGGYGRRELCLHSDIDLLIVSPKAVAAEALDVAQPLFLPLWDLGYDLGHGFRSIDDCLELAAHDNQVLASFLDLRLVAGNHAVYKELADRLNAKLFGKRMRRAFLTWLEGQHESRLKRYGDASTLVEPQLKEGIGGLRDYHRLAWLARFLGPGAIGAQAMSVLQRFFLRNDEFKTLEDAVGFLLQVRTYLHHLSERRNDTLYLDLQTEIAARVGFGPEKHKPAVEVFLGRLHRAMADLKALSNAFWESHKPLWAKTAAVTEARIVAPGVRLDADGLSFVENPVTGDPLALLRIFEQCLPKAGAAFGLQPTPALTLSWEGRRVVAANSVLARKVLGRDSRAFALFESILESGRSYPALDQMLESGFLATFIPEFGKVQDCVQFDAYHTYPVGRHTLVVVQHLESLGEPRETAGKVDPVGRFVELWAEKDLRRRVLLAALFHDIAKGGPDHQGKGATVATSILHRFGVEQETVEDVAFLVRNHLLLADTATRRDLSDESVVVDCGNRVGSVERLKMLYLLTYADSRATGPKAWNDWKARLLSELYAKILRVLQAGVFAQPHAAQTMLKKRDAVRGLARKSSEELPGDFVEHWLGRMPSRYTLSVPGPKIVRHLKLIRELEKCLAEEELRLSKARAHRGVVALDARTEPGSGIWEVVFAARSQPGLFAAIAGVLALHDINIFSADAFIWSDGVVVAVFLVSDPPDALYAHEYFTKVRSALKYALTGKLSLDYRLDKKRDSLLSSSGRGPATPVRVNVDNTVTDFYSVIEVRADDRVGLLYEIARCLEQHHIDVHIAKVATDSDRAMDFFYVRDAYGQKIEDAAQQAEIVNALAHRLS